MVEIIRHWLTNCCIKAGTLRIFRKRTAILCTILVAKRTSKNCQECHKPQRDNSDFCPFMMDFVSFTPHCSS